MRTERLAQNMVHLTMMIFAFALLLGSLFCPFLIFLDGHKWRNIYQSIMYLAVFIAFSALMTVAVKMLQFGLLYLVILAAILLFGFFFPKNRKKKEQIDF